jgi:hypothetical protein
MFYKVASRDGSFISVIQEFSNIKRIWQLKLSVSVNESYCASDSSKQSAFFFRTQLICFPLCAELSSARVSLARDQLSLAALLDRVQAARKRFIGKG